MDTNMKNVLLGLYAELLVRYDEDKRVEKLEELDELCGPEYPDWPTELKDKIVATNLPGADEAIHSVDMFHSLCV